MSKRVKIESLWLIISSFGTVCGAGIDPAAAWRDAVEASGIHSCAKDMMLSGSYGCVEAVASATYEPASLNESRSAYQAMRAERYGKGSTGAGHE